MNTKDFAKWVDQIYATEDQEISCVETQALLPAYAETKVENTHFDPFVHKKIETHLQNCTDCSETFTGLEYLLQQELEELPLPVANELPESVTAVFTD